MTIDPRDIPHKARVLRNIADAIERGEFDCIVSEELRAEGLPTPPPLRDPSGTAERIRGMAGEIETPTRAR